MSRSRDGIGFGNAGVGVLVGPGTQVFSMTVGKSFQTLGSSRLRWRNGSCRPSNSNSVLDSVGEAAARVHADGIGC
jgi:hypothetical protein